MPARLLSSCRRLRALQVRGANILGLPVIVTEQYPKALGSTVQELKDVLSPASPVLEKTRFSMVTDDVRNVLRAQPGITQVCVGVRGAQQALMSVQLCYCHLPVSMAALRLLL